MALTCKKIFRTINYTLVAFIAFSCGDKNSAREKNDTIDKYEEYYSNGKIKLISTVKKGEKIGELIEYFENGNVKSKGHFIENRLHEGECLVFYENGVLKSKTNYKNGMINGEFVDFNKNGSLRYCGNYINSISVGTHRLFYEDDSNKIHFKFLYINFQGKPMLVGKKEFDHFGKLINDESNVITKMFGDTVKLGEQFEVTFILSKPKYEKCAVHIGNYDSRLNLIDSIGYSIYNGVGHKYRVILKAERLGTNVIRGYMEDYKIENSSNKGHSTIGSLNNWFEIDYFVVK